MTSAAGNGLATASIRRERLTFLDAADGDVSDETSSCVATDELFQVFRDLDDTLANWLLLAGFHGSQIPSGDIGLRHHVGFDDPNDRFRLQNRKYAAAASTSAAVAALDSELISWVWFSF